MAHGQPDPCRLCMVQCGADVQSCVIVAVCHPLCTRAGVVLNLKHANPSNSVGPENFASCLRSNTVHHDPGSAGHPLDFLDAVLYASIQTMAQKAGLQWVLAVTGVLDSAFSSHQFALSLLPTPLGSHVPFSPSQCSWEVAVLLIWSHPPLPALMHTQSLLILGPRGPRALPVVAPPVLPLLWLKKNQK